MEGAQTAVFAEDQEEGEVGDAEGPVVAGFLEEGGVADVEPGFAEDGAFFEREEGRGGPPVGWVVVFL